MPLECSTGFKGMRGGGGSTYLGGRFSRSRLALHGLVGVRAVGGVAEEDVVEHEHVAVLRLGGIGRWYVTLGGGADGEQTRRSSGGSRRLRMLYEHAPHEACCKFLPLCESVYACEFMKLQKPAQSVSVVPTILSCICMLPSPPSMTVSRKSRMKRYKVCLCVCVYVVVVVVDSHIQRIVLATEETTVTQQVSHRPIKCQSRLWSQRGTKVNGSHHGDNPLLRPTGIQIATKSYAALQAMAPTNIKTVHQTSLLHIESNLNRLGMLSPTHDQRSQQKTGKITLQPVLINKSKFLKATHFVQK